MQDARKILFEKIGEDELQDLAKKDKSLIELWTQPTPAYNDYDKCKRLLRFGLVCYKYNYKNNKFRKIVIQVSSDM